MKAGWSPPSWKCSGATRPDSTPKPTTCSPPHVGRDAVATHAARHLAWLRGGDEAVATARARRPALWLALDGYKAAAAIVSLATGAKAAGVAARSPLIRRHGGDRPRWLISATMLTGTLMVVTLQVRASRRITSLPAGAATTPDPSPWPPGPAMTTLPGMTAHDRRSAVGADGAGTRQAWQELAADYERARARPADDPLDAVA